MQLADGLSLDSQEKALHAYCDYKGLRVAAVIKDVVSGGKALKSRKGGRVLVDYVNRQVAGTVVVYKLDRLFRSARDALNVIHDWNKRGVGLHLTDMGGQSVDTTTAGGKIFFHMLVGFAEFERDLIADRVRAAMAYKRARGEKLSSQPPYGYKQAKNSKKLVPDDVEQEAIARIHELRSAGTTMRDVAAILNKEEVPSRGKAWYHTTVARILKAEEERHDGKQRDI
jgi:DNA invertase Pin-like site-specific DNA recombinase